MIRALGFFLVIVGWLAGPLAAAGEPLLPEGFTVLGDARVASVVDGDTLVLADGREVRLVGIQAPKLPLGRRGFRPWPLAPEARRALEELAIGRAVSLHGGGATADRHGRVLAHLVRDDGLWLQGEMLARGLARVYSFPDNRTGVAAMLAIEADARRAGRGIWSRDFYAIRDADTVRRRVDRFEIVEDVVEAVATVRGVTYLNFGADWREDFTVEIDRRTAKTFDRYPADLSELAGTRIRVRGWVTWKNGPTIKVTHPEQIERELQE